MKVGISTSVIQRGQTGIAQYVFALVRAFLEHVPQHEFYLLTLEEDVPLFNFAADKLRIVRVAEGYRNPVDNILWHQTQLPRIARELQLDILHVPSYRRLMWPRPCAMVGTIHDLAPFTVNKKYDWTRMLYGRVIAKRLARRQHEIIAISQNTARDIHRFFKVPMEKINVVHNGVDHARFYPVDGAAAQSAAASLYHLKKPFFLYVARLEHPGKNHVRLITAFNQFKLETRADVQLVLVGSDWSGAEIIHRRIKESPFCNDILCLGFVPDEKLPVLYRAATAFIYPSLYEGFGMPPIEAMACGCPVLSSTRGSLEEVIGQAALRVDPEDITAIKWELARLWKDPALRESLRSAGLIQAQRFSWQKSAQLTLDVYSRALYRLKAAPAPSFASSPTAPKLKKQHSLHVIR